MKNLICANCFGPPDIYHDGDFITFFQNHGSIVSCPEDGSKPMKDTNSPMRR